MPAKLAIPTTEPPISPFLDLSTMCFVVSLKVKKTPSKFTDNTFL